MNRLHWLSGTQASEGGFEDLQTDVMRFMAILAFCLMAVFALVQSMPLTAQQASATTSADALPQPSVSPVATKTAAVPAPSAKPLQVELGLPPAVPLTVPAPASPASADAARGAPLQVEPELPPAVPLTLPAPASPAAADTSASDQSQGLTLRFSSDAALRRLVARGKVGLFAFSAGQSWRLVLSGKGESFHAAQAPTEFHAMAAHTVPRSLAAALPASGGHLAEDVTWGVTLPPATRYAIARLVREFERGALIIASDGRVRREEQ